MPFVPRRVILVLATGLSCVAVWACTVQGQTQGTALTTPVSLPLAVGNRQAPVAGGTPVDIGPTTPPPIFRPVTPTPAPTPTGPLVPFRITIDSALNKVNVYGLFQFLLPQAEDEQEKPDLPYSRELVSFVEYGNALEGGLLPTLVASRSLVSCTWTLDNVVRQSAVGTASFEAGDFIRLTPLSPATGSEALSVTGERVRIRILPQPAPFLGYVVGSLTVTPVATDVLDPKAPSFSRVGIEAANVGKMTFEISGLGAMGR
ncbi:MAG: hypothetical protein VKO21_00480 [Candidatus Sericytochromatia bacterium]|nr:hypothetical protein [Candidatus Sericytochromatia bacterium]